MRKHEIKRRVYGGFIDLEKAYDNREALWQVRASVSGSMVA